MRIRLMILGFIFLMGLKSTSALQDCGAGLPCGPLPWALPALPELSSPTPFPTVVVTSAGTSTPTPGPTSTGTITATPTITPTPSATNLAPVNQINDSFATLQGVMDATQETVFDRSTGFDLPGNASNLFGYLLGLQTVHFGIFTPLIQFIFFGFFLVVGIKLLFILAPVFVTLINFVLKVVGLIKDVIQSIPGL